jgi:hypothetical protein
MRVWLDDVRPMPKDYDVWVKTAIDLINLVKQGKVTHISFDHDLGEGEETGYYAAIYIELAARYNQLNPISWEVHSANPDGAKRINYAMTNAQRAWYGGG